MASGESAQEDEEYEEEAVLSCWLPALAAPKTYLFV